MRKTMNNHSLYTPEISQASLICSSEKAKGEAGQPSASASEGSRDLNIQSRRGFF